MNTLFVRRRPVFVLSAIFLAACDEGIAFEKVDRCSECAPGDVVRGVVEEATDELTAVAMLGSGTIVASSGVDATFLDTRFRPLRGRSYGSPIRAIVARDDGSFSLSFSTTNEIRLVGADAESPGTIPSIGEGVSIESHSFAGNRMLVDGVVTGISPDATLADGSAVQGMFRAIVDVDSGAIDSVFDGALGDWSTSPACVQNESMGDFTFAMTDARIAELGLATPPSDGFAAGVVRLRSDGVLEIAAWATSSAPMTVDACAVGADGSIALVGHTDASVYVQQSIATSTTGVYLATINPEGTLRWAHRLGPTPPASESRIRISEFDRSVVVSGATSLTDVALVDGSGVAWTTVVDAGADAVLEPFAIRTNGNVLVSTRLVPEAPATDVALTVNGATIATSHGLAILELKR